MAKTGKCAKCGETSNGKTGGSRERCGACAIKNNGGGGNSWRHANKARVAELQKAWRAANPERRRELQAQWKKKNPGSTKAINRQSILKNVYGLTVATYDAMLAEQSGCCAICDSPNPGLTKAGAPRAWSVDHDHATGAVRGLLCRDCNSGLGSFKDNAASLLAAERYLQQHRGLKLVAGVNPNGPTGQRE